MKNVHRFALLRFGILLVVAVLTLFGSGCSRTAKKQGHLTRGQKFFNAQQYDKAEIEFLNALRLEQTNSIALRHLGLAYHEQGRVIQAYAFLQKASEVTPADEEVRLRLAGVLRSFGRSEEARAHVDAVLTRNPQNEEALMLLGDVLTSTNEIPELRRRIESLRPQAEQKAAFHLALGSLDLRQRHTNDARLRFERALELDPQSSPAHMAMGNIFLLLKDQAKADAYFKKAAELSPVRSARKLHYADFKLRQGDTAAARAHLEPMAAQAPDYLPTFTRLSEVALLERRFDDALDLSRRILARDPRNYEAMLLLGRVNLAKGDSAKAVTDFERVVSLYPRVPHAYHQLALAHVINKNHAKAVSCLQQGLAIDPANTDSMLLLAELNIRRGETGAAIAGLKKLINEQPRLAQAHLLLANAYRIQRDLDSANLVYAKMAQSLPDDPQPYFLWGQNLLLQQQTNEARQRFEKAIETSPGFVFALDQLIELDIAAREYARAHKRVQEQLAAYPRSAPHHLLAARVHSAQTNFVAAEQALSQALNIDGDYMPAYLALARVYVASDKHKAALEKLHGALAISSNSIPALMQIGMIHTELKDYAAARNAYERIIQINPRHVPALNNLAYIYSEHLNRLEQAFTYARAARDLRPRDPIPADTLGWILFKRGEYSWALSLLQESANSPAAVEPGEVLFHLGMAHYMLGEEAPARVAFERALQVNKEFPGKAEARDRLIFLSERGPVSDVNDLEKRLEINPTDPILLTRVAHAYERSGAPEKALAVYQRAVQQNPRNIAAMIRMAEIYAGPLADQAKAMQLAKKAREFAPEDAGVHHILGRLAFGAGDHKWALSLLQETARKLPDDPGVLYDLAWAWYSTGRMQDADLAMRQALSGDKPFLKSLEAKQFVECNRIYQQADISSDAQQQVANILAQDPTYPPALLASALILEKSGDVSAACDAYRRALKRFPHFTPAHHRLANLLIATDLATAFNHAAQAREGLPDDPDVARTLGILTFRRNDYARAAQLLRETLRKRPNDPEALYYLGSAHFQLNEKEQSRQALERALAMGGKASFAADAQRMLAQIK